MKKRLIILLYPIFVSFAISQTVTLPSYYGVQTKPYKNCGTTTDADGNVYLTIVIGDQCWMRENLKTTRYNNGTSIPNVTLNSSWATLTTPAYCWYNNDGLGQGNTFGALYNWFAVNTGILCPTGWHVPNDDEWKELEVAVGMIQDTADLYGTRGINEGSRLADNAALWNNGLLESNPGFSSSNFDALPGGLRKNDGSFFGNGNVAYFWSVSMYNSSLSYYRRIDYNDARISRYYGYIEDGFSVRCIKN